MSKKKRASGGSSRSSPASSGTSVNRPLLYGAIAVAVIACVVVVVIAASGPKNSATQIKVPQLSAMAQRGEKAFSASCAACHGVNASGTAQGPTLIQRVYEPSHHGDAAFYRAVRMGVRPHHWTFGPMPKIAIADRQLKTVVAYVRELQKANGIY